MIQTLTKMIDSQDVLIQELKANVTKLQEQIESLQSQSTQAQTQLRIDSVSWTKSGVNPTNDFSLSIRNTGSVAATIESVSIRTNTAGSSPYIWKPASATTLVVGGTLTLNVIGASATPVFGPWVFSTSYVIRITATTGFYYEMVATTPSS
jgi:hypothetical protein